MGDFRATIRIEVEMFEKTYRFHPETGPFSNGAWLNWSPDEDDGIDSRVREFFARMWEDAQQRHAELVHESRREEREREAETRDRAEYERLKAKFQSG